MEYKPLSELAKDEDSCKKVFEFCLADPFFHWTERRGDSTLISGNAQCADYEGDGRCGITTEMYVTREGFFFFYQRDEEVLPDKNYFEIVDFIRSLGYSA